MNELGTINVNMFRLIEATLDAWCNIFETMDSKIRNFLFHNSLLFTDMCFTITCIFIKYTKDAKHVYK